MPDLNYEQSQNIRKIKQFDGQSIVVWNLDGRSDRQIQDMLSEMLIAATSYQENGNTNHVACATLVNGFTGVLKAWWDCLGPALRNEIKTHTTRVKRTREVSDIKADPGIRIGGEPIKPESSKSSPKKIIIEEEIDQEDAVEALKGVNSVIIPVCTVNTFLPKHSLRR